MLLLGLQDGFTPLQVAIGNGQNEVVHLLLNHGSRA
jgi:ankyrin repeat protein